MKPLKNKTGARGVRLTLAALLVAFGLLAMASSASAVDWNRPSHEYSNNGGWIPIYPCPTTACAPKGWVPSGTAFYMDCWEDWQWTYGNYWSNRWFWGYNGYWGYVPASYVYGQIAVRHC